MTKTGLLALVITAASATLIQAQPLPDWKSTPWVEPQDSTHGMFFPDEYAWRLFVALNWPAATNKCEPDTQKKIGDKGLTVWESWPLKTDVFLANAIQPQTFDSICQSTKSKVLQVSAQNTAIKNEVLNATVMAAAKAKNPEFKPMFLPPVGEVSSNADEEVRMNKSTFEFIRDKKLYDLNVQQKMASDGAIIEFPRSSKEVKAHWIELKDIADHNRYYTGVVDGRTYGLVALHITTKDIPRWFWATFEHVDNEKRWPAAKPLEFAGWQVRPVDKFACAQKADDCNLLPQGIGLEGTKFANYRLKATQVDWVNALGDPTVVVNSKIESAFMQQKSSCMSCHALALIGDKGQPMPFDIFTTESDSDGRVANFIGVVSKKDYVVRKDSGAEAAAKFMQLDFVWSLRNARRGP